MNKHFKICAAALLCTAFTLIAGCGGTSSSTTASGPSLTITLESSTIATGATTVATVTAANSAVGTTVYIATSESSVATPETLSDYSCVTAANNSCTVNILAESAGTATIAAILVSGETIQATATATLTVTGAVTTSDTYMYVTDSLASVALQCKLNKADGTIQASSCTTILTVADGNITGNPVVQAVNGSTYVYVPSAEGLFQCPINTSTGVTGTCIAASNTGSLESVPVDSVAIESGVAYLGLGSSPYYASSCSLDTTTGLVDSTSCAALSNDVPESVAARSIAFNTLQGTTSAYFVGSGNNVNTCVNSGSVFDSCTNQALADYSNILVVASNPNDSAYIYLGVSVSGPGVIPIVKCSSSDLTSCSDEDAIASDTGFVRGISFHTFANGRTYAYIADLDTHLNKCLVDATSGNFSECAEIDGGTTATTAWNPTGTAFFTTN